MSLTTLEYDTLNSAFAVCRTLQGELQPRLAGLQQIYDSVGGVKETLTQGDLDSQPSLSGLTKGQCDDALYVLTALLLPVLTQNYAQLAQLAARYRSGMAPLPTSLP